jgi:hypothetical protein
MYFKHFFFCLFLFVSVMFSGCAKQLTRELRSNIYPMKYMMDSKNCEAKKPITVKLETIIDSSNMPDSLTAKTSLFLILPFVVCNAVTTQYNCTIGRSSLDCSIKPFLRSSFEAEAARSGCFEITRSDSADYTCSITLSECKSKGPYNSFFVAYYAVFVVGSVYGHTAGPGNSTVTLSSTLKNNKGKIIPLKYSASNKTLMLKNNNNVSSLQTTYVNGLVEALSFSFKQAIEQTIQGINSEINKDKLEK